MVIDNPRGEGIVEGLSTAAAGHIIKETFDSIEKSN